MRRCWVISLANKIIINRPQILFFSLLAPLAKSHNLTERTHLFGRATIYLLLIRFKYLIDLKCANTQISVPIHHTSTVALPTNSFGLDRFRSNVCHFACDRLWRGVFSLSHTKNKNRTEGEDRLNSLSLLALDTELFKDVDLNDVVEKEDSEGVFVSGHSHTMAEVNFKNMLLSPRCCVFAVRNSWYWLFLKIIT